MTIYRIQRGRYAGRYDVPKSIQTMEIGEEWHITDNINIQTARNACTTIKKQTGMRFICHCPGIDEPYINIIRTK